MYECMNARISFAGIWRFKAPSESKVAPYDSPANSTLFRHGITEMRCRYSECVVHRYGYDSESNHEPTQNQMFFA